MNKNKGIISGLVLVLFILTMSGCLEYFNFGNDRIIYEAHPTKIQYDIRYGYRVECRGNGNYNIKYNCDIPEVLIGTVSSMPINHGYKNITLANNPMKHTIAALIDSRFSLRIIIIGGQIDEQVCQYTDADAYRRDAMTAASLNKE